jgi:hypothetical protein
LWLFQAYQEAEQCELQIVALMMTLLSPRSFVNGRRLFDDDTFSTTQLFASAEAFCASAGISTKDSMLWP